MIATRPKDKVNITVSAWGEGGASLLFHTPKGSFKNSIYLLFSINRTPVVFWRWEDVDNVWNQERTVNNMANPNPNMSGLRKLKKGDRLNPNGRPKGKRDRGTIARYWLEAMQSGKNPISGQTEELSQADWVFLALLAKARKGDVPAIKELMDSGYGKIADKSDVMIGGDAENPLAFANLRGLSDEELATMTALLEKAAGGKTTE